MRILFIFLFGCLTVNCCSQELRVFDSNSVELRRDSVEHDWYRSPSIRWNAAGLLNFFAPAASLVFEYPLTKRLGFEVEGGPLLRYSQATFVGERFNGIRLRGGPKVYMAFDDNDLFYLRFMYKYDNANISTFKSVLDPSGSFMEERLLKGKFTNSGWLLFAGFMRDFGSKHRFVFDVSVGLGWTSWNEELFITDGTLVMEFRDLFEIDRSGGSAPAAAINVQFGYRF